MINITVAYDYS